MSAFIHVTVISRCVACIWRRGSFCDGQQIKRERIEDVWFSRCGPGRPLGFGGGERTTTPAQNVSARRHANLAAAQHLAEEAFQKIAAAQRANECDMDGSRRQSKRAA
jgi:hypothetical protein